MLYDVIVIGTGPSGSISSAMLAGAGFNVLALEKGVHPRSKPCGGCISKRIDRYFDIQSLGVVERVINGVIFTYRAREEHSYTSPQDVAYMVDRMRLDQILCERARASGVDVREGSRVRHITQKNGIMRVKTDSNEFESRIVIGADGANGITRGLVASASKYRKYVTVERRLDDGVFIQRLENKVLIDVGRVVKGYGWIFPHSDYLSAGIAKLKSAGEPLINCLSQFLNQVDIRNVASPTHAHPIYSFAGRKQRLVHQNIVLVGEAGGLTDPFLGEGIFQAIRSGQIAACCVANRLRGVRDALFQYEQQIAHEFYREFRRAAQLSYLASICPRYFYRKLALRPRGIEMLFSVLRGEGNYNRMFWMAVKWLGLRIVPPPLRQEFC